MKRLVLGLIIVLSVSGSLFACSTNGQKDAQVKAENESATTVVVETMAQVVEKVPDADGKDSVQSRFMVGGNTPKNIGCNSNDMKKELNEKSRPNIGYIISFSEGDDFSLYNGMSWGANIDDVMKDFGETNIINVERSTNEVIHTFPVAASDLNKINDDDLEIDYIYDEYSIAMFFDKNTRGLKVIAYMKNFYF